VRRLKTWGSRGSPPNLARDGGERGFRRSMRGSTTAPLLAVPAPQSHVSHAPRYAREHVGRSTQVDIAIAVPGTGTNGVYICGASNFVDVGMRRTSLEPAGEVRRGDQPGRGEPAATVRALAASGGPGHRQMVKGIAVHSAAPRVDSALVSGSHFKVQSRPPDHPTALSEASLRASEVVVLDVKYGGGGRGSAFRSAPRPTSWSAGPPRTRCRTRRRRSREGCPSTRCGRSATPAGPAFSPLPRCLHDGRVRSPRPMRQACRVGPGPGLRAAGLPPLPGH